MLRSIDLPIVLVLLVVCRTTALAEPPATPATQPTASPQFVVSDMRVQTIAGFTYLYDSSQTTLEKIGEPIGRTLPAMEKDIAAGKFHPVGPMVFVYRDMTDIAQPFKLDIGFPVPPETVAEGEFKTRKVEPFKCATVLFSGPMSKISDAYQKLMAAMTAANLRPTTTIQEFHLYFEGRESPNNVVLIQVGIE